MKLVIAVCLFAAFFIGGVVLALGVIDNPASNGDFAGSSSGGQTEGTQTTPATPGSASPSPSAAPACGQKGGTCTAAQVSSHNSPKNCWVIYNGSYYDITTFVNQHPGGAFVFTAMTCGHDVAKYLEGKARVSGTSVHAHSADAFRQLGTFKLGPVSG
jgi:hypothetical protein